MSINIGSQLISKLGSPNSKLPLATKDLVNNLGYTYFSYDAGGSIEGKDRFVDEVGTGLIWLFGIPVFKKLIDSTLFKAAKISPEIDVRVLNNKNQLNAAIENAPTDKITEQIKKAAENLPKTKALNIIKFATSLGLTLLSFSALTMFKQNMTKKSIEKEYLAKQAIKENKNQNTSIQFKKSPIFADFEKDNQKKISFGSGALVGMAEEIMLNPIKNMMLLDVGISGSRLLSARTKGELMEYGIKEGSFLFFIYLAGNIIEKGINSISEKLFKAPIALDAKFLDSDFAEKLLKDKKLQTELSDFTKLLKEKGDSKETYDFIFKNQDNIVIKAAKNSGIISTIKDSTDKIDTRKFIDLKEIDKLTKNLSKFIEKAPTENIDKYLGKLKGLKVASTILNVGICCLTLGYAVPKAMYKYRKSQQNGNNDFHVKTEYEKQLATMKAKTL